MKVFITILLLPLYWIYSAIVLFRHFLFDVNVLKSKSFNIPIICIGNITVGGTGKTPMSELIISELKNEYNVAYLSRGYKRKTKGFVLATEESTAREIGDEPKQIKNKFSDVIVAVDANRKRGIERLLKNELVPDVIILDDAFQHRYVDATLNIVLMDYNRPIFEDFLLPIGRLRDTQTSLKRADIIIVTKCPSTLKPIDQNIITKKLEIKPYQKIYFSYIEHKDIYHLSDNKSDITISKNDTILCLTGIAQPTSFINYLKRYTDKIISASFSDHHNFSKRDIKEIEKMFDELDENNGANKYIFTTEKDAMRLKYCDLSQKLVDKIYYVPIEPNFFSNKKSNFVNHIKSII